MGTPQHGIRRLPHLFLIGLFALPGGSAAAGQGGGTERIQVPLAESRYPREARLVARWRWERAGGAVRPIAVDHHPSGVVAAIEGRRHRVFLTDGAGAWQGYARQGGTVLEVGFASRIFARSGLFLFTLDPEERAVDQFDLQGTWESRLDLEAATAAAGEELADPIDLCLDRSGDLFILDRGKGRILHFDRAGALQQILGQWGDWILEAPLALDVDGRGQLYVLETRPAEILVLGAEGQLLRRAPAPLVRPAAFTVDVWGNAFVADEAQGAVCVMPMDGSPSWWIQPPSGSRLVAGDLAVDDGGRLLIADPEAAQIWVYAITYEAKPAAHNTQRKP